MSHLSSNLGRLWLSSNRLATPNLLEHVYPVYLGRQIHQGDVSGTAIASQNGKKALEDHKDKNHHNNKRWLHYNQTSKPTPSNIRERNTTVTSYYNQTSIDKAAQEVRSSFTLVVAILIFESFFSGFHSINACHDNVLRGQRNAESGKYSSKKTSKSTFQMPPRVDFKFPAFLVSQIFYKKIIFKKT